MQYQHNIICMLCKWTLSQYFMHNRLLEASCDTFMLQEYYCNRHRLVIALDH